MNGKRLIEVAFPLKQVSLDSVHEKNVRHGHISTLHIWPARRPLAGLFPDSGRAGVGEIEFTKNEWARACNERGRYWLSVVFDCGTAVPRLHRVRDPFSSLLARAVGGVVISEAQIIAASVG